MLLFRLPKRMLKFLILILRNSFIDMKDFIIVIKPKILTQLLQNVLVYMTK